MTDRPVDPYAGSYPAEWWPGTRVRAMARPAEYDVFVTAEAPEIAGDTVAFATLPSGDIIVDEEQGDADLSPLANAVEQELRPPYRAEGTRQERELWAVGAQAIDLRRLDCEGEELDLVAHEGRRTLTIDGIPSTLELPALWQEGDYALHGSRLDGDLWEIRVNAL